MSWFKSIKEKLTKTSHVITTGISSIFSHKKKINAETLEEFEDMLLMSDMGPEMASQLVQKLRDNKFNAEVSGDDIRDFLRNEISVVLSGVERSLEIIERKKPTVIMLCGVNGNGKTTTAGKLAMQFRNQGLNVMLGACDTFRAAAIEQLQEWGERVQCKVIVGAANSDPASVGFRALQEAIDLGVDVLILDTAGRLHNKVDLMNELQKCIKVLKKLDYSAPHEIIMVVDSTTGQNAYNQISTFNNIVNISGLIFTKLDSTAKGGVVVGAAKKYGIPIYAIGVGEKTEDLRAFNAKDFVDALL
jgi:fused signal recognition particle receptor